MTAGAPLKPSSAGVMRPSYAGRRQPVTMFPCHRGSRPDDDKRSPGAAVPGLAGRRGTGRGGARAHLCGATSVFLFVIYLAYALDWTFASHLGPASTAGGLLLWVFELLAAIMSCAYLWEICDALGT